MFLKIFLWFWLAIALIIGALSLVALTTPNEPYQGRWLNSIGYSLDVYADALTQIRTRGEVDGAREFVRRLSQNKDIAGVCLLGYAANDDLCFGEMANQPKQAVVAETLASGAVENEIVSTEEVYAARRITFGSQPNAVLVARFVSPRIPQPVDNRARVLRILAVILTAGIVCYGLARYLTAPLGKLREATRRFADGDLSARVGGKVARRRDEIAGLARDFDEMAARIENLIAAQKNLTTDISHELRSPLARLSVALEIARVKASDEVKSSLDRIEREAARLNEMIGQMLLLSKLESGAATIEKRDLELSNIVREVAADADFEARAANKSVTIKAAETCRISGNRELLRSAIENVVRNAVRHTPDKTAVEVELTTQKNRAVITIRDYGAGVPDQDLQRLFEPFYRAEYARTRKSGGFGLGLAITARAVHAHGGQVAAMNHEQAGLIIKIELPLA